MQPSGRTGTKEVIYGVPQRRWCKTCRTRQHDAVRNKKLRRAARLACPHCWQVTPGSVLWKVISSCSTKKTVPHDANWPASCDLLQKRTFFIWSSQKHNFQWHKLGCFNGSTSNGTNWSASSNLLQKGSLPMAQTGLLHLIWFASSNGASWFALFDFLQKIFPIAQTGLLHLIFSRKDRFQWHKLACFIGFSPKRITGLIHLIFSRKDHFQWQKLISFKSFPSHSMAQIDLFHLLFPQRVHFLWHHVLHCSPGPFCNSALSACCKTIYTVNLMLQILSFQLDHHIAFTRAPLNVRGLVMIFTQYTFNKLSFHPGSSYCSHARTTYVMDQGFSVPFEIFPCRIWSPTPQPAFARHRPSLYVGPLVQWWQQSLHPCSLKDDFWECLASIILNNCSVLSHRIPT